MLTVFTLSFFTNSTLSQNAPGIISGEVRDVLTKQPLPGANVIIVGTNLGAACDENGYYVIRNVKPAKYTLKSSMISYEPSAVADVVVNPNRNQTVIFELRPMAAELKEVSVSADYFSKPVENPVSFRTITPEEIKIARLRRRYF